MNDVIRAACNVAMTIIARQEWITNGIFLLWFPYQQSEKLMRMHNGQEAFILFLK